MLRNVSVIAAMAACVAAPAFAQSSSGAVNWTGPYVGVNLGYGGGAFNYPYSGTADAAGTNPVAGILRQSSSGVVGGGQIGYNLETPGGLVMGLETDLDGSNINGTASFAGVDSLGNASSGDIRSRIDYLGTLRGRVGEAMFNGRFVPYVTGGLAYGDVRTSTGFNCTSCGVEGAAVSNFGSQTTGRTGWTVGAGTDYALTDHLSFRAEYLYVDLGHQNLANGASEFEGPGANVYNANVLANTNANVMRVGLNYRF